MLLVTTRWVSWTQISNRINNFFVRSFVSSWSFFRFFKEHPMTEPVGLSTMIVFFFLALYTHIPFQFWRLFCSLYFLCFALFFSKESVYIYVCIFFLLLHFFPCHWIKKNNQRLYLFHVFFFLSFVTNFKQTRLKTK